MGTNFQNVASLLFGWINSRWQKQPLQLGYSGDVTEAVSDLNAVAGSNALVGSSVPAGEIWEVQHIGGANKTHAVTIWLEAQVNGQLLFLSTQNPPVGGWASWTGKLVISQGDRIRVGFAGCTAGDELEMKYHAVRIDIDQ